MRTFTSANNGIGSMLKLVVPLILGIVSIAFIVSNYVRGLVALDESDLVECVFCLFQLVAHMNDGRGGASYV